MSSYRHIWFFILVASLGGVLYGFDTGAISIALSPLSQSFGLSDANYVLKAWVVSIILVGAFMGALLSGKVSEKLGRKNSIILLAVIYFVALLAVVLAQALWVVFLGRFFMGVALGLSLMIIPMYLSEIAPSEIRGAAVFTYQLFLTIGILLGMLSAYFLIDEGSWRIILGTGMLPALILAFGMIWLPESPRWLILKGKEATAAAVLTERLKVGDAPSIIQEMRLSVHHKGSIKDLFSSSMFPLLILAFGLFAFQQLSGVNAILYFAPSLFSAVGFSGTDSPILAAVCLSAVNMLATILGVRIVDRLGRRKLLFIGFTGVVICLGLLGAAYQNMLFVHAHWLILCLVLIYMICFAVGLGGVPYIMMSELFPLNVRGPGMAISSAAAWIFNILVASTFLTLVHALGVGISLWLYAILSFGGLLFAYFLAPETKGVSLEHIEAKLYAGKSVRHIGR